MVLTMLRAYQFGPVSIIAPVCATGVMLNVIVSYFALKEKDRVFSKIIGALLIIIGIVLVNM